MSFSFIYNTHQKRTDAPATGAANMAGLLHMPIPESRGIFSEIHSPITTLEISYIMA